VSPSDESEDSPADQRHVAPIAAGMLAASETHANAGGQQPIDRTLRDARRGREVPVRVYLPAGSSPAPTIIFSHGVGGSRLIYGRLARAWARGGFAVVLPSHPGSDSGIFKNLRSPTRAIHAALADTSNWENRPRDVSFVIDALGEFPEGDALRGRFDLARVGVGGHSFGSWTAAALAGARLTFPGESAPRRLSDPRPRAFLMLSPVNYGGRGASEGAWSSIERPVMAMTGTLDATLSGGSYEERVRPWHDLPANGKNWLVVIEGAEHLTFSGGRPLHPVPPDMQRAIEEATLAFWDLELNGDERAKSLLQPGALEGERMRVFVEVR
jgi:predicted dienelactone hydrolase